MLATELSELAGLGVGVFALIALSAGLCALFGRIVIPRLVKMKINDGENRKASEYLAMLHGTKKNTPTMGGIFVVPAILCVACISVVALAYIMVFGPLQTPVPGPQIDGMWQQALVHDVARAELVLGVGFVAAFVFAANAALGFVDDYRKLKKLGKDGLSSRAKLAIQTAIAVVACTALYFFGGAARQEVVLPFANLNVGVWMIPLGVLAIVGAGNAFNLTDGLDGLAGGTGAVAFFALAGAATLLVVFVPTAAIGGGEARLVTAIVGFAASGALIGFLLWNKHPARVFMGDTGSLSLGALMGFIAVMSGLELILAVAGGVFVVEALSVMLQVGYFKATKGKRIFKCAPLHHHFQFSGWHETKVTRHFIGAAIACAMIALALSVTMIRSPASKPEPTAKQERAVPDNAVVSKP